MARADYGRLAQWKTVMTSRPRPLPWEPLTNALEGLETWADLVARKYNVQLKEPLNGYCTWYADQHGGAGNAPSLEVLMQDAAEKLGAYGMDLIQIDDGWQQGDAQGNGVPTRTFMEFDPNGPYPKGMLPMSNRFGPWA